MPAFKGFEEADFDAYAESKWSSNVYNLERLRVKEKLLAMGRVLLGGLESSDGTPLSCEASTEHPAIWNNRQVRSQCLCFMRSEAARAEIATRVTRGKKIAQLLQDPDPFNEHVHLRLSVDPRGLEVSAELSRDARVDHENLLRKLGNHWERTKLPSLILPLPSRFHIQAGGTPAEPAAEADVERVIERILGAGQPGEPAEAAFVLRVFDRFPRTDPVLGTEQAIESVRNDLAALLPVYRFIEWSRSNDHVAVAEDLRKEKKEKLKRGLERNDRVRVTTGLWSGKKGTVQEVDARGMVKVLIGKVTVQLSAEDLVRV